MEDSTFRFFAMFSLLLATFVNYLIPFLIKPAVLLVNLLTEFSVGSIYLGFQLAALFINFVAFVFLGGFSSEFSLRLIEFFIEFLLKFLSPLAFEQPFERSNGYAIRLDIASARVFAVFTK